MNQLLSRRFATLLSLMIMVERILVSGAEKGCKAFTTRSGASGNITCYFDDDDARLQMNVFIEHLIFNAADHEIVASCQLNEGRYTCSYIDGYQVVGTVMDSLTAELPDISPEYAGQYWCGGFESHPLGRTHCELHVTDDLNVNGPILHSLVSLKRNDTNEGIKSFCTVDTIALGGSGIASCFFSRDISKTLTDMNVYMYKDNVSEPPLIVSYQWINGRARIVTNPDYEVIGNLTDRLEILIKNATREHEGSYKCIPLPSKGLSSNTCTLVINEDDATESEKESTTIILSIAIPILFIFVVLAVLFILYKKRKRQPDRRRHSDTNQMKQPASSNDAENNTGVAHKGSVKGQGTSDAGESSNVLLPK